MTRQPDKVIRQWLDSVNTEGKNLTTWETRFMENVTDQFCNGGKLSLKKEQRLEQIYCERVK